MKCTVIYATPDAVFRVDLLLDADATAGDALVAARAQWRSSEPKLASKLDWDHAPIGVFGRRCDRAARLSDGDRVEIYRALSLDPKQQRRRRAQLRR